MLKKIEIVGFKSFAKKAGLSFGTRVVGVVGPNGSGKSNVAESFRFVLGEQSMKAMRSGKGEDLIWNGSAAVPKANKASVILTFDNASPTATGARIFPQVDLPEVTLERAVYRDGQNEYFLNGKQVRLKDVTELLASISIGTSKHHIISQGQADRMLNSSPTERREMLLDALGLTAIDLKKSEAERNLGKTETHMKEVEAARREARPRLLFLEKQVEKYAKAEKIRTELTDKATRYIHSELAAIEHESATVVASSKEPRIKLADLTTKRDTLRAKVASTRDTSHIDALERERVGVAGDIAQVEAQLSTTIRERAKVAARLEMLEEMTHTQPTATTTPATPPQKAEALSVPHTALEALQQAEERVKNTVRMSGDYRTAFAELTSALVQFWGKVATSQTAPHTHERPASSQTGDTADTTNKKEALTAEGTKLAHEEASLQEKLAELRAHVFRLDTQLANQKLVAVEGEREVLELSAQIAELTSRVRELDTAVLRLRERKEAVANLQAECEALLGTPFRLAIARPAPFTVHHSPLTPGALHDIERLKIRVEELGTADDDVQKEHKDAKERDEFLAKELADVTTAKESLVAMIAKLESEMDATFTNGLRTINTSFEEFFRSLFGGGEARLAEVKEERRKKKEESKDSEEDEDKPKMGIDIEVHLPKKKVNSLGMLSGGERALTSIALICALSQVNPPPFIILDETDAALDEANSTRFANMVQTLAQKSQCVVITHNRATMAAAGELYGITMGSDGVSKLLSVKLEEAERVAK